MVAVALLITGVAKQLGCNAAVRSVPASMPDFKGVSGATKGGRVSVVC